MYLQFSLIVLTFFFNLGGCSWATTDLRPAQYNPLRRPQSGGEEEPVKVEVNIELVSLLDVNEFEQSFTVDIIYRLSWFDFRLRLPPSEKDFPLILDISWQQKLWVPDVYFQNALETSVLNGFSPITFLEVNQEHEVSLVARMTVKLTCGMQLFAYPHDRQQCFFDSTSLSYTPKHLVLHWGDFGVDDRIYFPKFSVYGADTIEDCPGTTATNRSCVRGVLKLSRKMSFYMTRYYLPSILIVATTFVGFWLPASAWPARVTVVLTPFLSLVTIHNAVNNEIKVSYVVALHVWMFFCMFVTFMGLLEFLAATIYDQAMQEKKKQAEEQQEARGKWPIIASRTGSRRCSVMSRDIEGKDSLNPGFPIAVVVPEQRHNGLKVSTVKEEKDKKEAENASESSDSSSSSLRDFLSKWKNIFKRKPKEVLEETDDTSSVVIYSTYINPVDRLAKWLFPLIFSAFIALYFVFFINLTYYFKGNFHHL